MKKLLICDDNKESLVMLKALLDKEYQVTVVPSGKLALSFLEKKEVDLILMDVQMPEMSGIEVIEIIKSHSHLSGIPVLFLTGVESVDVEATCLEKGGDDYIRKPVDGTVLKRRISRLLELYELRNNLAEALEVKSRQLDRMALSTILTIGNTVDAKDEYTGGHSLRVAMCARDIAKNMGWEDEEVQNVYNVALLHDIGKIAVPDSVLNKPGRLDDDEFEIIKRHPEKGNEILGDIRILPHVQEGAHYHHERWDGRGYPQGLKGEEIPIYARIIAVADTYDAMNSNRPYRKHLPKEKIISEIERCKGTQFDPKLADLFLFMLRSGYEIDPEITKITNAKDEAKSLPDEKNENFRFSGAVDIGVDQDSMTGLFNRSYLNMKVGSRIVKERSGSLLLIDFDNFIKVNDRFGRLEGDRILKEFAKEIKDYFDAEDIVCRMSGDEFAVFIGGKTDRARLSRKAQALIDKVRLGELAAGHDNMLSISIGISLCPEDGITFEELYNAAGKALYASSQMGMSMYRFYGSENDVTTVSSTSRDMKVIKSIIEGEFAADEGALSVGYTDFQQIYNYVYRYVDRNRNQVQVILFTILPTSGRELDLTLLDQAMHSLDMSVVDSLRKVDVGSKYSSNQYIVILTDTDIENGRMVAERVKDRYYKLMDNELTRISLDIETVIPK